MERVHTGWLIILTALFIGLFIGEQARGWLLISRLEKVEASLHSAQQPKERDTFAIRNDGGWVFTRADTADITSRGSTKRIVSIYYSK